MRLYSFIYEINRYMPYSDFMPRRSALQLAATIRADFPSLCLIVLPY